MSEIRPYRPSNGSEGDCFQAHFCDRCIKDRAARAGDYANGCEILCHALAFGINHELYPKEWVTIDREPQCTAFMEEGDDPDSTPIPDPDPAQLVLIADPTEDLAYFPEVLPELIEVGSPVRSFRVPQEIQR